MATSRVLVVYYSRSGTTRRVAEAISPALHCDIEAIVDTTSRAGAIGYLRSFVEAFQRRPSPIKPTQKDPGSYDLVVIGTPVWAGSLSSPIRSYLMANKAHLRKVAFFCTFGGRGSESTFGQMQDVAGKAPLARCAIVAREALSDRCGGAVTAFVKQLETPSSVPTQETTATAAA
jgi:flavodoxin